MKDVKKVGKVLQNQVFSIFYSDTEGRKCEIRQEAGRTTLRENGEIMQAARDARIEIFKEYLVWTSGNGFRTKLCPVSSIMRTKIA